MSKPKSPTLNFTVRWTPDERALLSEVAVANQLRPTDIVRIGTLRLINEIKTTGGLLLRPPGK